MQSVSAVDVIDALREEKEALLIEDANRVGLKQRLDELGYDVELTYKKKAAE